MADIGHGLRFIQRPYLNSVGLLRDEPGWKAKIHYHSQTTELQFFVRGTGQVFIDGQTYPVKAGDLAIFPSKIIHYDDLSNSQEDVISYFLRFQEFQIQGMEPNQFLKVGMPPVLHTGIYAAEFRFLFESVYAECEKQVAQNESVCENYLMALLYLTNRVLIQHDGDSADSTLIGPVKSSILLMKEAIDLQYSEKVDMKKLALQVGGIPEHITYQFQEEMGVTPAQYLVKVRISEAKRLLANSNMTLAEIARSVGYNTAAYFSTQFKLTVGMTPGSYRQTRMGLDDHNCV